MVLIVVLNNTLRNSDSELLEYARKQNKPVCLVLFAIGGDHKRSCDIELARRLSWARSIHWVGDVSEFPADSGFAFDQLAYQDLPELKPLVSKLARRLKIGTVPFSDFIAVDESLFSPVFSVFWARVGGRFAKPSGSARLKPEILVRVRQLRTVTDATLTNASQLSLPAVKKVVRDFEAKVCGGYGESRNNFGALFDYARPSSSFVSPYLSSGALTVRQLAAGIGNQEYLRELAWNQYCVLFVRAYPQSLTAEYGIYDRKRRWASKLVQQKIKREIQNASTDEPLMNAVVVQLKTTGWVSNRLRMVFANYLSQRGLPWRVGARFFERHLVDYFESANVFNWQFCYNLTLGRPHNFSIALQQKKFDPEGVYVERWTENSKY